MVGVVFHFKELWVSDYYLNGFTPRGLVSIQKRGDVVAGYVTYSVIDSNGEGVEEVVICEEKTRALVSDGCDQVRKG